MTFSLNTDNTFTSLLHVDSLSVNYTVSALISIITGIQSLLVSFVQLFLTFTQDFKNSCKARSS